MPSPAENRPNDDAGLMVVSKSITAHRMPPRVVGVGKHCPEKQLSDQFGGL
jgi:hypothetical protein